ncbi:MAG: trypsin-like peptidase domain-containing protein [bacterium]
MVNNIVLPERKNTMRRTASLVALFLIAASSLAIARIAVIPEYLSFPVLIKFSETSSASALYFKTESNAYLVTAKHVLYDLQSMTLQQSEADLVSYVDVATNPKKIVRRIFLGELEKDGRILFHPKHDLVVVRFGDVLKDSPAQIVFENRMFKNVEGESPLMCVMEPNTLRYDDVGISNEVYLFGYPRSIGLKQIPQIDYDMPLLRRGIVAGKNEATQTIVVDCPAYYGNSGGPVCQVEQEGLTTKYTIIGIVSQFVPFVEQWENKTHHYTNSEISNSGYSVVTPIDAMFELIERIEKAE